MSLKARIPYRFVAESLMRRLTALSCLCINRLVPGGHRELKYVVIKPRNELAFLYFRFPYRKAYGFFE